MQKGIERAQGTPQKNNIIAIAYGAGEGLLVGIQAGKDAVKDSILGRCRIGGFEVPVELEEFGEEWENEGKGYLGFVSEGVCLSGLGCLPDPAAMR